MASARYDDRFSRCRFVFDYNPQAFYGGMMGGQWIFLSDEERRTHCPGE